MSSPAALPDHVSLALCEHFAHLTDPRVERRRRHLLLDLVVLTLCALLAGAEGWADIAEYGRRKEGFFRTFLCLPNGIPHADTFRRVLSALCPQQLLEGVQSWVAAVAEDLTGKVIALDGKTLRGAFDAACGRSPFHLVSAWVTESHLLLGQLQVEEKSNEIPAVPKLLDLLEVEGATVTLDAMGCQKPIAAKIIEKKADYVLRLRGNHGTLHHEVETFWTDAQVDGFREVPVAFHQTFDGGEHGRSEVRRVWTTSCVAWMADRPAWKGLRSLILVESERSEGNAAPSFERRLYLSSLPGTDAARAAYVVRAHWGVENGLHWQLDVAFGDDRCRVRTDHGPANLSLLRKLALMMLKRETVICKRGIAIKRKSVGWDDAYLLHVLQAQIAADLNAFALGLMR